MFPIGSVDRLTQSIAVGGVAVVDIDLAQQWLGTDSLDDLIAQLNALPARQNRPLTTNDLNRAVRVE